MLFHLAAGFRRRIPMSVGDGIMLAIALVIALAVPYFIQKYHPDISDDNIKRIFAVITVAAFLLLELFKSIGQ